MCCQNATVCCGAAERQETDFRQTDSVLFSEMSCFFNFAVFCEMSRRLKLCFKDFSFRATVQSPQNPTEGEQDVFVMDFIFN